MRMRVKNMTMWWWWT